MKLGQQILIARKNKSLTQEDLGNKVGLSKQQIGLIERGLSNPRIETLQNIAKELGVCFRVG